ncbi:AraC family transcriptional regulator [Schauerella aestuarii]|uniref:AraC family transcriptional regulator n=1 Tax=Schauerella aestuarii TaxID=2511204 RepID=UPI001370B579|nr:helix-turn-helix transcriptional regulator [Achromobacter aestuarii]MYZ42474.1 AraC family transcriptional regulator [Achromobacter aestuarii]
MADLKVDVHATNSADDPVLFVLTAHGNVELAAAPHRHARGQLFGSLRGLLTVELEEGVWVVPAIHAVWLPPHHTHAGRAHGPYHGWSVYIAEQACENLPKRPCTLRTSALLREAVLRAGTWPVEPLDAPRARIAEVILDEIRTLPVESLGLPMPRDPRLQNIAKALIADPADVFDIDHWALKAAMSTRTLSRRFVAETGFNFTAWRQRARLMRSLEMLAGGTSVTAIALDLGYSTASAYIGQFKRTFGDTPSAYRTRL